MVEQSAPQTDGGSTPTTSLQLSKYQQAKLRFKKDPSKCFQRHLREVWGKVASTLSLKDCRVVQISKEAAQNIILKYEWLQTMGSSTSACYGLVHVSGEILGAVVFGSFSGAFVNQICDPPEPAGTTVCLQRGACSPNAPDGAASFLIRWACKQAFKDFGWKIFYAYSDSTAGEIGTVYQAVGWKYLGVRPGKTNLHYRYQNKKTGEILTSYQLGHNRRALMKKLKAPATCEFRTWLCAHGWRKILEPPKGKYVWFEDSAYVSSCRFPFYPYPKREALK